MSSQKKKESRRERKWGNERRRRKEWMKEEWKEGGERKEWRREGGLKEEGRRKGRDCELGNTSSICSECFISHAEFHPEQDAGLIDLLAGMENTAKITLPFSWWLIWGPAGGSDKVYNTMEAMWQNTMVVGARCTKPQRQSWRNRWKY